jgi:iron complex outermembrane recepter protein
MPKYDSLLGRYSLVAMCFVAGLPAKSIAQESSSTLDKVTVIGERTPPDYRTEEVKIGPLGDKSPIDTPYSIDIVPDDLSQNQQLKSVREVFRYLPSVQGENIRPQTRGLQAGVVQNTRIDGLNMASTTDYPVEQFDRIEVLNGLAGAIYGPANPAGTFNYVLKRPTKDPYRSITGSYTTQSSNMISADVGDSLGDNKRFGYRVNVLADRGEGYVDLSRLERTLASLAIDYAFTDYTRLELNASRYHYVDKGFPGTFALANNVRFPSAPDPTVVGLGQPYAGDDNVTKTFNGRVKHDFGSDWQVSAGVLQQDSDRASTAPTNTLTSNAGAYTTTAATTTFSLDRIWSNIFALNGRLHTGDITHDLILSNTGFDWNRFTPYQTGAIMLGTSTLANPAVFDEPLFPDFENRYKALNTKQQSVNAGDTIGFGPQWSVGLIASQSWIEVRNLNKVGTTTSRYDDDGVSENATLSYKPAANMSVYGSYADSLQQGDIAPTGSTNAGTELAPYRAKQFEFGYKVGLSGVNLAADVFRIRRPYAVVAADNVFSEQGEQTNNGIEVSANGDVSNQLAIFGGVAYLDPKVTGTGVAATDGKQVLGLSKVVASVLLDYRISAVPGLAFNLHVQSASPRFGDNANTYQVAGFTILDLGARYSSRLWGLVANWNLAVDNLANRRYWANITPTGQNGYTGAGNGTGTLGTPRLVREGRSGR